jgi:hypothetical protein
MFLQPISVQITSVVRNDCKSPICTKGREARALEQFNYELWSFHGDADSSREFLGGEVM